MNGRNWLSPVLVALVLGLALMWGCSDDDNPADPGGGDPGDDAFGTITGVVHRSGGFALAEATVSTGDVATTTNEEGYFVLSSVPEGTALVSIATTGYSSTFRVVAVSDGSSTHLADIVLVPMASVVVDGAAGGSAATSDGAGQVEFDAASFVDGAGNPYTDDVTVQLNALQPMDADFYGSFPGDFSGVREDGTEVPFISYGFMTVQLTGVDKAPLEMAPGATATLSLNIGETKAATAPATIPMWYFDETDGQWYEEGEAVLEGNVYTADVAHFTTWNWDLPVEDICSITGMVVDESAQPVAGARVISRSIDYAIMDETVTSSAGTFTVRAVRNSVTDVQAVSGSLASEPMRVSVAEDCPFVLTDPLVLTVPAYSIALTWGEIPNDLDSHLLIPMTWDDDYDYYHIYYSNMGMLGDYPYAILDTDDTSSYGPEIITGTRMFEGRFQYWVHNYSTDDSDDLAASGAMVQLNIGGALHLYDVADVPLEDGDSSGWWHVFDILYDGGSITVQSVMQFQPEFSDVGIYSDKAARSK